MNKIAWIALPLFFSYAAFAQNAWQYSKRIERSMVVTGTIEINPDGSVHDYALDQPDKLLPQIVEVIGKVIPTWKFQPIPVNGKPSLLKGEMSIRVVADKMEGDRYAVGVRGVSFSKSRSKDAITYKTNPAPTYPREGLNGGVGGTAYIAAMLDRSGHVEKAAVLQIDLHAFGPEPVMARLRKDFGEASVKAIKQWTFNIPAARQQSGQDHWVVRIPINYQVYYDNVKPQREYGHWDAYAPGPIEHVAWLESDGARQTGSPDAIPDDLAFQDDRRFVLLNPPGNG